MRKHLILALGLALVLACGGESDAPGASESISTLPAGETAPAETATPTAAPAGQTRYGIAGLIPPNYPNATEEDWSTLFGQLAETGPLVGVYQGFESAAEPLAVVSNIASGETLVPVLGVGVKTDAPGGGATLTIDPANASARQQFVDTVVDLVQEHDIQYLLVDTEVDRIHADDPAAFDAFVDLYTETYDAVKAVSPGTKVFTAFQLEELRGEAFLTGREWEERWDLIDHFGERLDIVGFTSYPFFDYEAPSDIPDDYYAVAAERAGGRPIAFMELGWPSAPLSTAPGSGYGGSEAEQVEFIERFAELTTGLDVELVLWAFPNDVGGGVNPAFESISLRTNGGEPKPGLGAWQALAGVE